MTLPTFTPDSSMELASFITVKEEGQLDLFLDLSTVSGAITITLDTLEVVADRIDQPKMVTVVNGSIERDVEPPSPLSAVAAVTTFTQTMPSPEQLAAELTLTNTGTLSVEVVGLNVSTNQAGGNLHVATPVAGILESRVESNPAEYEVSIVPGKHPELEVAPGDSITLQLRMDTDAIPNFVSPLLLQINSITTRDTSGTLGVATVTDAQGAIVSFSLTTQ